MDKFTPKSIKILLLVIIVTLVILAVYAIPRYFKIREGTISTTSNPSVKREIAWSPVTPDAEKLQQVISKVTAKLAAARASSKSDRIWAQKLKERGLKDGIREDPDSLKNAIINLNKSLSYQFDLQTITDLSYFFSCLGRLGIDPFVNFARSAGIIDSIHNSVVQNREDVSYIRSNAVKIINYVYKEESELARNLWNHIKGNQPQELSKYNLEYDPRILEAKYLVEEKWSRRSSIADHLIRVSPNNPKYFNYKGVASYHAGDHKLARQCFERALAINQKYLTASANLNALHQKQTPRLWTGTTIEQAARPEPKDFPFQEVYLLFEDKGRILVETVPEHATVKVANLESSFEQGMQLEAGNYHVQVSADGYETESRRIELGSGDIEHFNFTLFKTGESFTNSIGMKFALIHSGTFMMGSSSDDTGGDKDETRHSVKITKPYNIQTTEVTQGQWQAVMGKNPSWNKDCGDDCPVDNVSWNDIQEFIRNLNRMDGTRSYRLPTEAEWEYACRAGTTGRFCFGNDENLLGDFGWYDTNSERRTHRVAQKKSNAWGLHDMHGNVWEWCQDWYGQYPVKEVPDPRGPASGSRRVLRGGSFYLNRLNLRCADRDGVGPQVRNNNFGFRLVAP